MTTLLPLNPTLHACYASHVADLAPELIARRNQCAEEDLDLIDRELVARTWWRVLRPDRLAGECMRHHGWRSPLTIDQAAEVILALGGAGYPITGNGAPDYEWGTVPHSDRMDLYPVAGADRDRVLPAAARYWAEAAAKPVTYISLGDERGFMPRPVQYDQPGSMHPQQRAAVTFGPAADRGDECGSHAYMRQHTRRLILVSPDTTGRWSCRK